MSSIVRSIFGAALLVTGASAAMAQSAAPPVASQPVQVAASTTAATPSDAPLAGQPQKPNPSDLADNSDPNGGHNPNSTAGMRAFFTPAY